MLTKKVLLSPGWYSRKPSPQRELVPVGWRNLWTPVQLSRTIERDKSAIKEGVYVSSEEKPVIGIKPPLRLAPRRNVRCAEGVSMCDPGESTG